MEKGYDKEKYFIVKKKALPEVLIKVVEANRMLESEKAMTVQEATESAGISRSSYYKYKDDILPFTENAKGKTITFMMQMEDEPGILSLVLSEVAKSGANVLTINQSIPVNGIAPLTISVEIHPSTVDVMMMVDAMEGIPGIRALKILSRE
ncbi:MAG: ACT domain-containing protein [Acetivibrio sp.]